MNAATSDRSVKKTFKTITTQILLLFLVVTFAVWGIGDIVRGGPQMDVAKVGDRHITVGAFQQEVQAIREQAGGQIPDAMLNSPMFRQQVVARLVQNTLVEEAALDAGIVVAEDAVAEKLRKDPYFQDLKGKFNADGFRQFLASQRISESQFVDSIARQARAQALVGAYELDQVPVMPALAALQAFSDAETRDVLVVSVTKRDVSPPPPATEEALLAFYDANKDPLFMNDETRDFAVLTITSDTIKKAASAKAKEGTSQSEATTALVQTISNTLDDLVASGEKFDDAAKKLGINAVVKNYKAIAATSSNVNAEILKQAYALGEGQTSSLETTKEGALIAVHVSSVAQATPKPFKQVRSTVKGMVDGNALDQAISEKAHSVAAALRDAADDAARVAVIDKEGVTAATLRNLKRGDRSVSQLPYSVLSEVFSEKVGTLIRPAATPDGSFVIPLVLAVHAPEGTRAISKESQEQALRVVRGMVSNALLNDFGKSVPVRIYDLPQPAAQQ